MHIYVHINVRLHTHVCVCVCAVFAFSITVLQILSLCVFVMYDMCIVHITSAMCVCMHAIICVCACMCSMYACQRVHMFSVYSCIRVACLHVGPHRKQLPVCSSTHRASIQNSGDISKLYYWDETSGSPQLRYWNPSESGREDVYDIEDLDGPDRIRNVYYVDRQGNNLRPNEFRIVERQFFEWNDRPMMLATIMDASGGKNITLGVLKNP